MNQTLSNLIKKYSVKGFVGPAYTGLPGKFRLAWEEYVIRTDVIFVATPSTLKLISGAIETSVEISFITNTDELVKINQKFDSAYYSGFTENWSSTLESGEELIVGFIGTDPVAFIWMQKGNAEGYGCYYGMFFTGEARLYRAGVIPEFRGQGVYTRFMQALLRKIFTSDDIQRVYIDCHKANIVAYKSHLKCGFCETGSITVIRGLNKRRFIRWQ